TRVAAADRRRASRARAASLRRVFTGRDRRDPRRAGRNHPLEAPPRPSRDARRARRRVAAGRRRQVSMTDDRNLTLTLEAWLAEGPDQMPDRVADVVRGRIDRQPQRPSWRFGWPVQSGIDPTLAFVAVSA